MGSRAKDADQGLRLTNNLLSGNIEDWIEIETKVRQWYLGQEQKIW